MTETQTNRPLRRGRIFPEIQWSPGKKAKAEAERKELHQRCWQIFERLQPELIKTHYNWLISIEPESGNYLIEPDMMAMMNKIRQTYPGKKGRTVADTCRQRKTIKTLATDINTLLQLQNKQQKYVCCKCICKSSEKIN